MPSTIKKYLSWNNTITSDSLVYIALEIVSDIRFLDCNSMQEEDSFSIAFDADIQLSPMNNKPSPQYNIEKGILAFLAWFQYFQKLPYKTQEEKSPLFQKQIYKEPGNTIEASFILQSFLLKHISIKNADKANLSVECKGNLEVHLLEEDRAGIIQEIPLSKTIA